jgi:hypothetical protein
VISWFQTFLLFQNAALRRYTWDGKDRAKPGVWKDTGPITWTDS